MELKMQYFTFKAYDGIFTTKAESGLAAMEQANRELLWYNPASKDGAWWEAGTNTYKWIEGNFFD